MTNKTKKSSKWLKLALISTASLSTLATVPTVICCANTNNTNNPTKPDSSKPNSAFCRISYKIRSTDAGLVTLVGPTMTKVKKNIHFGSVVKPEAQKTGYKFVGWSINEAAPAEGEDTVLTEISVIDDNKVLYPVFTQNGDIAIKGKSNVSFGENNIQFSARILPEGVQPQLVDWYVTDDISSIPSEPQSTRATIDKESGILNVVSNKAFLGQSFYVFAVIRGHEVPSSISEQDTRAMKLTIINPWEDPDYAKQVIVDYTSDDGTNHECIVKNQEDLYNGEASATITLQGLNDTSFEQTIDKSGDNGFNFPIHFGNEVTIIKDNFLDGFAKFNNTLHFPKVVSVGSGFLAGNTVFNQPLQFSNALVNIGSYFMLECTAFNQSITFGDSPQLSHIDESFMEGCTSFIQKLTLPASLTEVEESFLLNCPITSIVINCSATAFRECKSTFAREQLDDVAITHRIQVDGSVNFDTLKSLLKDNKTKTSDNSYIRELYKNADMN